MKIAIIGAGFTSLAASYYLKKAGFEIEVFEASDQAGGLAGGFKDQTWEYILEYHYHHIFKTDHDILDLMTALGLESMVFFKDVKTVSFLDKQYYQLDSALTLLKFKKISLFSRLRTGAVLALLKVIPSGKFLEKWTAHDFLIKTMGKEAYENIFANLFLKKFGSHAQKINMAWFWARIFARSKQLGYFKGGFATLAKEMVIKLRKLGVKFHFDSPIQKVWATKNQQVSLNYHDKTAIFDAVLYTTTAPILLKTLQGLSKKYQQSLQCLKSIAAQTLVMELDANFFSDQIYWLNVNNTNYPFLAVIEHTNFINQKHYHGQHLIYVAKYLDKLHPEYKLDKKAIFKLYQPYLEKISPGFTKKVKKIHLFKVDFAQPVVEKNHSQILPGLETEIKNVYQASMQQIYPFDRGTNYAVQIGKKVAKLMIKQLC